MAWVFNIKFLLISLFSLQLIFWYGISPIWQGTKYIKPELGIVPPVPGEEEVKLFSFGDDEFYFRVMGFQIQNSGDTYGRSTSLKDYDYSMLSKWWRVFDSLDFKSNLVPSMVSYYFGSTPNHKEQIPYVVDYLETHADKDPRTKWWWYSQAIYNAKHKMKDLDRALIIANKLASVPRDVDMPIWARQMPAFMLEKKGEYNEACDIIINIIDSHKNLSEGEMNFMIHFINERIIAMQEKEGNGERVDPRCKALFSALRK